MSDEVDSFVLVMDSEEVQRHVPGWPNDALLAAAQRDGSLPEIRQISSLEIGSFAQGLPVIPLRPGHPSGTPSAEAEARLIATAISRAIAMTVDGQTSSIASQDDPFSDIPVSQAPEIEAQSRFLIRRRGRGFELRTVGIERFPWDMDRIAIGASMFGANFVEQPLDRMLTFAVTVADLGPMAPMASFLPKRWVEVPVVEGPSGPYFDISPVLLGEVAMRVRRATLISVLSLAVTGFLIAAAIAAAIWNSMGHPSI